MKIGMLGQKRIPSREGGVEIVVEELSTRMVKSGHEVTCYNRGGKHALDKNVETSNEKEYKGVKLRKCFTIDKKGLAAMTSSFFATIKAIFSKNEVIHYHAEGPCAWMWLVKWFTNKKIVATIHGLDWQRAKWGGFATQYIKFGEKCAVKYADEIIVLSKNVQQYFKDTYNRETVFIPNGVNKPEIVKADIIEKEYNLKKDDYILFLGRIVPEKGIHYLIDAYNEAKVDKKLVIAGGASDTDTYYSELKEKAKDNKNIIFTGFVQGQTLEELYSNAYIYCLPSDLEGMPLSLLEGMSYKNCCLTSDIKECSEVVEDKAVTFKKGNVKDLTKKLQHLCSNEKEVQKYKKESQNFILKKYNWDDVVDKTLNLYDSKKNENNKNNNKKNLMILVMIVFLLLQNFLQRFIGFFKYYDELFIALFAISLPNVIKTKQNEINKYEKVIIYSMILLMSIGILGNLFFQYQNIQYVFKDLITFLKFIIAIFYFKNLFRNYELGSNKKMYKVIIYIIDLFIVLTLLNYILDIFPGEMRYGLKTNQLIFTHPTFLAASCAFMYMLVAISKSIDDKTKKITMMKLLLLLLTTLRSKAFVFVVLAVILYYVIITKNKKIDFKMIVIVGVISFAVSINQIRYYFFNPDDTTARSALITTSVRIATEHFPIGAGFGTFGSDASQLNYSPVYEKYNIHRIWGLREGDGRFVSDNFWPMIIGQFGYIGLVCYVIIIVMMFKQIQKTYLNQKNNNLYYSSILAMLYLLISSTTESAFVNPISIMYAAIIGYSFAKLKEHENGKELKS